MTLNFAKYSLVLLAEVALVSLAQAGAPPGAAAEIASFKFDSQIADIPLPSSSLARTSPPFKRALDHQRAMLVQAAQECKEEALVAMGTPGAQDPSGSFHVSTAVSLDTPKLFVVSAQFETWCGGPHEQAGQLALTFEPTTGRLYDVTRLVNVKSPRFKDVVTQALLGEQGTDAEECDATIKETVKRQNLMGDQLLLTPNSLVVSVEAPFAFRSCFGPVSLPFEKLQPALFPKEAKRLQWPLSPATSPRE